MQIRDDGIVYPDLIDITQPAGGVPAPARTRRPFADWALLALWVLAGLAAWAVGALTIALLDVTSAVITAAVFVIAAAIVRRGRSPRPGEQNMTSYGVPGETVHRVRLFDGRYELLRSRRYEVAVDLKSPYAPDQLRHTLHKLVGEALAAGETVAQPRLEVYDANGTKVLDVAP
ncbi:hypothetical protein ACIA8K_07155 [Catenuloplanes sp. NPDC051500]|uniref:hypothetical protein n=1 Tax=Catenuloplanes sp. NPDC051500 TaxID=3363959 RepID=UPI0037A611EC